MGNPEGEPEFMEASEFKYMVPRWRCKHCKTYLMADVSICPDIPGPSRFNLAMIPVERIQPAPANQPEYHIHTDEKVVPIPDDGLVQYISHPGGEHEKILNAEIKKAPELPLKDAVDEKGFLKA